MKRDDWSSLTYAALSRGHAADRKEAAAKVSGREAISERNIHGSMTAEQRPAEPGITSQATLIELPPDVHIIRELHFPPS